jgi:hypothetical protein
MDSVVAHQSFTKLYLNQQHVIIWMGWRTKFDSFIISYALPVDVIIAGFKFGHLSLVTDLLFGWFASSGSE